MNFSLKSQTTTIRSSASPKRATSRTRGTLVRVKSTLKSCSSKLMAILDSRPSCSVFRHAAPTSVSTRRSQANKSLPTLTERSSSSHLSRSLTFCLSLSARSDPSLSPPFGRSRTCGSSTQPLFATRPLTSSMSLSGTASLKKSQRSLTSRALKRT